MRRIEIVMAVAAMGLVSSAMAGSPVLEYDFALTGQTDLPVATSFPVPKFNVSGAKLTQVQVVWTGSIDSNIKLTNNASTNQYVDQYSTNSTLWLNPAGLAEYSGGYVVLSAGQAAPSFPPGQHLFSVNSGDSVTKNERDSKSTNVLFTDAASLLQFSGSGSIDFGARSSTTLSLVSTGGNMAKQESTIASFSGKVFYTYSAVPEPTTMFLGLAAVAPLALHRGRNGRRRVA